MRSPSRAVNPHTAFHVIAWIEVAQHDGSLQQRIFTGGGIDFVQLARAGVAGERVAHARRLIRGVAADAMVYKRRVSPGRWSSLAPSEDDV